MFLIPAKTPWIIKKIFSSYTWAVKTDKKNIYLTFDDGPTPEITTWTLKQLKAYNAKATFFCIGNNIEKYPDVFNSILSDGHAIGNHTYNHVQGWKLGVNDYVSEVVKTQKAIDKTALKSSKTKLFRPPFGKIKNRQGKALRALGYQIIMWDVLSFDWQVKTTPKAVLKYVTYKTKNGSIVVFHDSVKASKNMQYVLPKFLEHFTKKGYTFRALS